MRAALLFRLYALGSVLLFVVALVITLSPRADTNEAPPAADQKYSMFSSGQALMAALLAVSALGSVCAVGCFALPASRVARIID